MKHAIVFFLFLAIIMTGCAPGQKIVGSWADPDVKSFGPYKKAFVVVMTKNKDANYYIETQITSLMRSRGFQVVHALTYFRRIFLSQKILPVNSLRRR
jgi:hypothetical protein